MERERYGAKIKHWSGNIRGKMKKAKNNEGKDDVVRNRIWAEMSVVDGKYKYVICCTEARHGRAVYLSFSIFEEVLPASKMNIAYVQYLSFYLSPTQI